MSLTISGILGIVISQILGDTVNQEQVANFIEVGGLLIFAAVAFVGRYRHGDLTWMGMKK